jgi:hypothetical protein
MVWIIIALPETMSYLKSTNQLRKLERYRYLLWILGLAVMLTIILVWLHTEDVFNGNSGGVEVSTLNISQGNEANFFLILICVAILWKPHPMARDFVYAIELSMQEDDEGTMTILEMTENVKNNGDAATDDESAEYNQFPPVEAYAMELSTQEDDDGIMTILEMTENVKNNGDAATDDESAECNQFTPVKAGENA